MNSLARYAFSSLSLSGKLHKLLDSLKGNKNSPFDNNLEQALEVLDYDSPLRHEAKLEILSQVKRDFEKLESAYQAAVKEQQMPIEIINKLEELIEDIRSQIEEKEVLL